MFKLRIFGGSEKADWEEKLSKIKATDGKPDGTLVGAQWDITKATVEPPQEFENGVKYRPIFITDDFLQDDEPEPWWWNDDCDFNPLNVDYDE